MNVNLTPELDSYIRSKLRGGRYASASEVVKEALLLMEHFEKSRDERLHELRAEISIGREAAGRENFAEFSAEKLKADVRRSLHG